MIDIYYVKENLKTGFIGKNIYCYDEVTSTNTVAKEKYTRPNGSIFIAKTQTNGRGRMGRTWQSDNTGLWFSILLKPDIKPDKIPLITLIAGLAVSDEIKNSYIKWPNDIIIDSKKICGILTELHSLNGNNVICGIGINVSAESFPNELKDKATSLAIANIDYDVNRLFIDIIERFENYYTRFIKEGFAPFRNEYKQKCITLNSDVTAVIKDKTISGTATDISENGELIISHDNKIITVSSGEVSVRGVLGYV